MKYSLISHYFCFKKNFENERWKKSSVSIKFYSVCFLSVAKIIILSAGNLQHILFSFKFLDKVSLLIIKSFKFRHKKKKCLKLWNYKTLSWLNLFRGFCWKWENDIVFTNIFMNESPIIETKSMLLLFLIIVTKSYFKIKLD